MVKYNPSRDIPLAAREVKDTSPSKIVLWILNKRNVERTSQSVTMWFKEHPDVYDQLAKELVEGSPTEKQAVDQGLFENGAFREIPSVKEWILYMGSRRRKGKSLHPQYVAGHIRALRFLCEKYVKHPARLTFHDAQEIFMDMEKRCPKCDTELEGSEDAEGKRWCPKCQIRTKCKCTFSARNVLKDFLKSKESPEWEKIGVGKPQGFGKYKQLSLEKPRVLAMLEWTKSVNFRVYVVDEIMWQRGLRINAVLNAMIENFVSGEKWDKLTVTEKFREVKTFKLAKGLGDLIRSVIGERKEGLIFEGLDENECAEINREALKRFAPELEPKIEMPNHAYRHFCAQYLRVLTNNNSKACAAIMQCSEQSFIESYGGATDSDVEAWENKYLPLMAEVVTA